MLTLICDIGILGNKRVSFDYTNSISVESSILSITDTAKLVLPRRMFLNQISIREYIKRGDAVTLKFGYKEHGMQTMFAGYITKVSSTTPITIECEDASYMLKQHKVKDLHFDSFNLKSFIQQYATFIKDYAIDDIELGEIRISGDVTIAEVFDYLKKNYPINLFFRDGKFYGILNQTSLLIANNVNFINLHIGTNTIDDSMSYTAAEDILVAILAKAIFKG